MTQPTPVDIRNMSTLRHVIEELQTTKRLRDIIIDYLAAVPAARKLLTQLAEAGIAISIITYMET